MSTAAYSGAHSGNQLPRPALLGAAALVLFALASVTWVRSSAPDGVAVPPPLSDAHRFEFRDAADGAVLVLDPDSGAVIWRYPAGTSGFARGLLRGLARERQLRGISMTEPFVVGHRDDGRLLIRDPATATDIVLDAFGSSNRAVFEALLAVSGPAVRTTGEDRS